MFYEIRAILKQVPRLRPDYDEEAATNIGIGGSLIWAVDTDDDKSTAMSGLMGKEVAHVNLAQAAMVATPTTIAQSLIGENGQDYKDGNDGKPICCPKATAPRKCRRTYSPKLLRLLDELHVAGSRADYDHQGVEVVVIAMENAIPAKLLLPYLHGEVKELALTAKVARAGAAEEPKLSAVRPATGRMSLLVVAGLVGGRQRTNCCKVSKPPPKPLTCDISTCDLDPSACVIGRDDYGNKRRDSDSLNYLEERTINDAFWQNVWQNPNALPSSFGKIRQPDRFINEQIGSNSIPSPLVILRDAVKGAKGRLETFHRLMAPTVFQNLVNAAAVGDEESVQSFMAPLRETVGVFEYLNDDTVVTEQDAGVARIATALQRIERVFPEAEGLSAHWNEAFRFSLPPLTKVSEFARTFMGDQVRYARNAFQAENASYREYVLAELKKLEDKIPELKYAFED
ncbi:MAG: hypothetical protein Q9178_006002 [Gyalolechia marmorata]